MYLQVTMVSNDSLDIVMEVHWVVSFAREQILYTYLSKQLLYL